MSDPDLADLLFTMLREIDAEAVPRPDGLPTGLRWYAGHVDPDLSVRATERSENLWSQRLQRGLRDRGVEADYQVRYPRSRQTCDLVLRWPAGGRFWLEVKRAYRECVYPVRVTSNPSFSRYLQASADDLEKLSALGPSEAAHTGLLLVGFDRAARDISDADLWPLTAAASRGGWALRRDGWEDRWYTGFRVRCWLWSRETPPQGAASGLGRGRGGAGVEAAGRAIAGDGMWTLEQVRAAFDATYPTKTAYDKKSFMPLLAQLGIGEIEGGAVQSRIREQLGSRNSAAHLFGGRGESGDEEYARRRMEACGMILEVLNEHA